MANKYYAVRNGRQIGIFNSWQKCKELVTGYKGAEFKSFNSEEEAKAYMNKEVFEYKDLSVEEYKELSKAYMISYVDGSYNIKTKRYGYGLVCIYDGDIYEDNGSNYDDEGMRNVNGEIEAVIQTIKYAQKKNCREVHIYYDYKGIEMWATGEWKANLEKTKFYASYMNENMKKIKVRFIKVEAHSGIVLNERADELAKMSVGI